MRNAALLFTTFLFACGAQEMSDPPRVARDGGPGGERDAGSTLTADAGVTPDAGVANALCPPSGPFGSQEGQTIPDVTLPDCEGNPHRLQDLCGKQATWLYTLAGWCPYCIRFAGSANAIYQRYEGEDFGAFVIITQDPAGRRADAAYCARARDQYGLDDIPVLYDDGSFGALGIAVNHVHLVLGEGARVEHRVQYRDDTFEAEIDRLLGR